MADTPTIIDCADLAAEATRLRALFTPCYNLTALDLDDLVNLAYSASLCGTTTGLDQDNIAVFKYAGVASGISLSAAAVAVNDMADFTVGEKELCFIRVSRTPTSQTNDFLHYDFYVLKDVGKGSYGENGTQIDASNLFLIRSSQVYSIPNTSTPVVYAVLTTDVTEAPEISLNSYSNGAGYVISSGPDYYFEMKEVNNVTLDPPTYTGGYALYRWIGANGHYGADGTDTAVNGDFVLVETDDGDGPGASVQDNVIKIVHTNKATQSGISAAVIAVNGTKGFQVDETENVVFQIPREQDSFTKRDEKLFYDYYLLMLAGKGTYGFGETAITSSNILLMRSTELYSVTTTQDLDPVVYELRTDDISEQPQVVLNSFTNVGGFAVQNNEDAYFEVRETEEDLRDHDDLPTFTGNFNLWRFVGAAGSYGASGVDTAVLGDFVLVEINEAGKIVGDKKVIIDTIEVINGQNVASDNISKTVNRDYWDGLTIDINDTVIFRALRKVVNGDASIMLLEETYAYQKDAGLINADSVDNDFIISSSKVVMAAQANALAATRIYGLTSPVVTTPEVGLNDSDSIFTIATTTYDTYFISNTNSIKTNDYNIYKFTGANGTYGNGGAQTAVNGDFTLVTKFVEDVTTTYATSQLKNDGENGTDPFITGVDIPAIPDAPTGLEAINEGGNDAWALIGRNAANFGNRGQDAIDFSVSSSASTTRGSTGTRSMTMGNNNTNPYISTLMLGDYSIGTSTNGYSQGNILFGSGGPGQENFFYNNLYANIAGGTTIKLGTSGADLNTAVVYNSLAIGWHLDMYAGKDSLMVGQALVGGAASCAIVGQANIDETVTTATQLTSTTSTFNPRFIVGTGNWNSDSNTGTRSNGFIVWSDGSVEAPDLTPALITAKGNPSLVTKEYVDLNFLSGSTVEDGNFEIRNTADPTKLMTFDASNISGAFTRVLTMANNNVDLEDVLTNKADIAVIQAQSQILHTTINLSAAEVIAIGTTPRVAIAAEVSGLVNILSVLISLDYGTVAFDDNPLTIGFSSASGVLYSEASFLNGVSDNTKRMNVAATTANDTQFFDDIVITGTDSVASGDSTIQIYITYELISTSV